MFPDYSGAFLKIICEFSVGFGLSVHLELTSKSGDRKLQRTCDDKYSEGQFGHLHRGTYMSAHVLLNLLNKLGKRDKNARLAEHFISFSQRF